MLETRFNREEASRVLRALAEIINGTETVYLSVSCLAVIGGHPDLLHYAQNEDATLARAIARTRALCERELEEYQPSSLTRAYRYRQIADLSDAMGLIDIAQRYRLGIEGQT